MARHMFNGPEGGNASSRFGSLSAAILATREPACRRATTNDAFVERSDQNSLQVLKGLLSFSSLLR